MPRQGRKSPLQQIASHFGVNASTVSRALAGDSRISDLKRKEICSFAESLRYCPNVFRRKRRETIGLMIFSDADACVEDNFQREFVRCASNALFERGYHVHVEFLKREKDAWPAFLKNGRVDGVLVSGHPPIELCQRLRESKIPTLVFTDTLERTGCFCVKPDLAEGTQKIVHRLFELGHRRIALLSSSRVYPSIEERYKAFCFALMELGLQPDPSLMIFDLAPSISGGRDGVKMLLERGAPPSAIVFINDYMALGGMMELLTRGFKLPYDISIASHDNLEICKELDPPLASVDISFGQMLSDALELLFAQLDNGFDIPVEKVSKSCFIERASIAKNNRA